MGIYINLDIIPNFIDPKLWEDTYQESLELLYSYPSPLMSLRREKLEFSDRLFYSSKLEFDEQGEVYWQVTGDMETKVSGETFILHKDIQHYLSSCKEKYNIKNLDIISQDWDSPCLSRPLDSKTQGYNYHNAILAVASLFESRIPLYARASGDITLEQAQEAISWANGILSQEIQIPISLDGPRLLNRLVKSMSGKKLLDQFSSLFLGSRQEGYRLLWEMVDPGIIKDWFASEFTEYSPSTIGSMSLMRNFLNATGDLESLVEICCTNKNGPMLSPQVIAEEIGSLGLSVPMEQINELSFLRLPENALTSVEEQFAFFCFQPYLLILDKEVYFSIDKILEVLEIFSSGKREILREVLEQNTQRVYQKLSELKEFSDKVENRIAKPEDQEQKIKFKATALAMRKAEIGASENIPQFTELSREGLLKFFICLAYDQQFILTELAWDRIQREQDPEVLKALIFTIMLNRDRVADFRDIQREILEEPDALEKAFEYLQEYRKRYPTAKQLEEGLVSLESGNESF